MLPIGKNIQSIFRIMINELYILRVRETLVAQPLREVPLGEAILREGTASSSSLEQEIDKFRFEEETVLVSEAEEGAGEHSCV